MTRLLLSLHDRQDERDDSFEFMGDVVLKLIPSSCDSSVSGDDGSLNESRLTEAISS